MKTQTEFKERDLPEEVREFQRMPFHWQGMEFYPNNEYSYRATNYSVIHNGFGNLYFAFYNGGKPTLDISNSLHKLNDDGYNHTDFTKSQFINTSHWLGDRLGLNFVKAKLSGKFEIAVNIPHPAPKDIYSNQTRYKDFLPSVMHSRNKVYGAKFGLGAYTLKSYDPLQKIKVENKHPMPDYPTTLRFEMVTTIGYLNKRGIKLNAVDDLFNNDNLSQLGNLLIMAAKNIHYSVALPADLEQKFLSIYYFFTHASKEHLKAFRKNQQSAYYRHKKIYKELLNKYQIDSFKIEKQISEKWKELTSS